MESFWTSSAELVKQRRHRGNTDSHNRLPKRNCSVLGVQRVRSEFEDECVKKAKPEPSTLESTYLEDFEDNKVHGEAMYFAIMPDGAFNPIRIKNRRVNSHILMAEGKIEQQQPQLFCESRNNTNLPKKCKRIVAALHTNDSPDWKLIMVCVNNDKHLTYYEWNGGMSKLPQGPTVPTFQQAPSQAQWNDVEKHFIPKRIDHDEIHDFMFLNQLLGTRACQQPLAKDIVNEKDGCFECSTSGPCLLFPESMTIPGINLITPTEKPPLPALSTAKKRECSKLVDTKQHFKCKGKEHDVPPFAFRYGKSFDHLEQFTVYVANQKSASGTCMQLEAMVQNEDDWLFIPFICKERRGQFLAVRRKNYKAIHDVVNNAASEEEFHAKLDNQINSGLCRLVDDYLVVDESEHADGVRIRIVPPNATVFKSHDVEHVKRESGPKIVLGRESGTLDKGEGVVVARYMRDYSVTRDNIELEGAEAVENNFKKGACAQRESIGHVGRNNYLGFKRSCQASSNPVMHASSGSKHDYFQISWNHLSLVRITKFTNKLAGDAVTTGKRLHTILHGLLLNGLARDKFMRACHRKILTQGKAWWCHGFASTAHVDKKDALSKKEQQKIRDQIEPYLNDADDNIMSKAQYVKRMLNLEGGVGIATTCIYDFLIKDQEYLKDAEIHQYFLYNGMKVAVRFHSDVCHSFCAHNMSHCTAVCVVKTKDGRVLLSTPDLAVTIFAWGGN